MKSLEFLDQQLKELLLLNGGDINILEHPYLIKEAQELGLNQKELSRRIRAVIVPSINWAPYHKIDEGLAAKNILVKGSISEEEANAIVNSVEAELQRPQAENYIRAVLRKRAFKTRERNSAEADSFKNLWMTEDGWEKYQKEQTWVEWLDEKAHSLSQLGEISFRKKEDAKYYLRNTNFLVPVITTLTRSPSKADAFSKIIENESNADKRFLKIIYRLNPRLPFSLHNQNVSDIYELFKKTATDYSLYKEAAELFEKGHIHIWIEETDAVNAGKLTRNFDYNGFLKFLYKVDQQHPFYLFAEPFDSPEQLIQKVIAHASYWPKVAEGMANMQLYMWFEGIGKHEWVSTYYKENNKFFNSPYHTDEDKKQAAVQTLIQVVDPSIPHPRIVPDQQQVQLLSVEGSYPVAHAITLQLENGGFVKAKVYVSTNIEGVRLGNDTVTFFGQDNRTRHNLLLTIDPLRLVKNKLYECNIQVQTEYETLSIPVGINVVFPKKAFYKQLVKYALFGFLFFALIRFLTGMMTDNASWFSPDEYTNAYQDYGYLSHYFYYFIALVLFVGGLIASYFLIRKLERI